MSIQGAPAAGWPRFDDEAHEYDALLVLSFGGPEAMEDVMPFLRNVAEGRNIPQHRLEEVAHHYYDFGGVSPINQQNRLLIAALEAEFAAHGPPLRIYFGNRNWRPFVTETLAQMRDDGVQRALVFVTSAFSSYSGCRQYREDVVRACETLGAGMPHFDKVRVYYNHPGFIKPVIEKTREALDRFDAAQRERIRLVFTAHSIPLSMARLSDYVAQLEEACRLVADGAGFAEYDLVYQSRSGPPHVLWLEPDICDFLEHLRTGGTDKVLLVPIGFISEHMEVLYDLDTEARALAERLDMQLVRAETVGAHPQFVQMVRELVLERMGGVAERRSLGTRGANHDICPLDCCLKGESARPPGRPA